MLDLLKQAVSGLIKEVKKIAQKKESKLADKVGIVKKVAARVVKKIKLSEREVDRILDDLEWSLLEADVALEVVEGIEKKLREKLLTMEFSENFEHEIREVVKSVLLSYLPKPFPILPSKNKKPYVIAFFGPNGCGKTTTVAKVAALLKKQGFSVVLAAADTFRAGAIEQLEQHAKNLGIPIVKCQYGTDPTAVAYDAINYARSRHIDVVLIDTAGRQEVNLNLMRELQKLVRVIKPDLKIYVGEAITGNAAYEQLKKYSEVVGLDAVILTKFDLDVKGGIALSVGSVAGVPIIYVGVGQGYEDLKPFDPEEFVDSLV